MEFTVNDKENPRRSSKNNKENVNPIKKNSTGAIKKTSQGNSCNCYNLRSSRPALTDLHQNKKLQNIKKVSFNNSQIPVAGIRNRKSVENTTFIKERSKPLNINKILLDSTSTTVDSAFSEFSSSEQIEVSNEDSAFWSTFLTVNNTTVNQHKNVQKLALVRKATEPKRLKDNYSIIHDSIPSLRRKTLKKQVSKSSGFLGVVNLDPFSSEVDPTILYSLEYVNDIISYIINKQKQNILKPELLNKDRSFLDKRASVINWLVKLHQYLASDTEVFFMTVRLFDKILTLIAIPESNYQLTAMAAYWISAKYNKSVNLVTARKLMELCHNVFTVKCLLEMEKTILLILQFNVDVGEPIIFVYYYIYILQLYESNMIGFCANYLLELLTLDFNCNTFPLTLQASSAVFLSLKFFNINEKVWKHVEKYFGYHDKSEMFEVQKIMIKNIILTNDEDCPYKESFQKYSSEKYGKVSVMIPQILARWFNVKDMSLSFIQLI